jgi:hypothetical protein
VYVYLSRNVETTLAEHEISLRELLVREGLSFEAPVSADPATGDGSRAKEPVTVLLASAAVIASLTPVVTRAIQALSHRAVVVETDVLAPVENGAGEVVRNASGEPVLYWTRRASVLGSAPQTPDAAAVSVEGPLGLRISYRESSTSGGDA